MKMLIVLILLLCWSTAGADCQVQYSNALGRACDDTLVGLGHGSLVDKGPITTDAISVGDLYAETCDTTSDTVWQRDDGMGSASISQSTHYPKDIGLLPVKYYTVRLFQLEVDTVRWDTVYSVELVYSDVNDPWNNVLHWDTVWHWRPVVVHDTMLLKEIQVPEDAVLPGKKILMEVK